MDVLGKDKNLYSSNIVCNFFHIGSKKISSIKLYKRDKQATAIFTPKISVSILAASIAITPIIVENTPASKMVINISFTESKQCCTFSFETAELLEKYNEKE